MRASYATWLAAALSLCISTRVHAQSTTDDATRAVARDLGMQGIDAFRANDFAEADTKLDRAYRLYATPTLGLWSARTRKQLGRWIEAAERYRETMRISSAVGHSETQVEAQQDASKELAELLPRIPTLTVKIENAAASEVQVTLDGVALHRDLIGIARPTNVGAHTVVAVRGSDRLTLAVRLAEADKMVLPVRFTPAAVAAQPTAAAPKRVELAETKNVSPVASSEAQEPSSILKPVAVVALGIGAVGLATWGVGAFVADDQLDNCPSEAGQHMCTTQGEADSYSNWKTLSTVGFYTGTAFAVIGVSAWLFASGREKAAEPLTWSISPTGASVRGTF